MAKQGQGRKAHNPWKDEDDDRGNKPGYKGKNSNKRFKKPRNGGATQEADDNSPYKKSSKRKSPGYQGNKKRSHSSGRTGSGSTNSRAAKNGHKGQGQSKGNGNRTSGNRTGGARSGGPRR